MCGITGAYSLQKKLNNSEPQVLRSLDVMQHRGPDFRGIVQFPKYITGHSRLCLLDLSANGNQPMQDSSGRYCISFNGEIFNYAAIKAELQLKGIVFNSTSDTEVLLQLLMLKGIQALDELNGFFALAFYDSLEDHLILARDRFGEKPLWYCQFQEEFYFASELKGLLAYNIAKEIDMVSLSLFLQFSYIPAPSGILKNICKLMPGNYILIKKGEIENRKWYNPAALSATADFNTASVQFESLLTQAVQLRSHADLPVGCFLSGGADSSVIALLASQFQQNLQTFSIGFPDQPFLDETKYAKEVAQHIGSKHEVFSINKNALLNEMHAVWKAMDEPFADSSSIASSMLARKVKKHVSAALSGDGADEILGGYNKHVAMLKSMQQKTLDKVLAAFSPFIEILPGNRNGTIGNKLRQLQKYTQGIQLSTKDRYLLWASWGDEDFIEKLLGEELSLQKGARINAFVQDIDAKDFNTLLLADQKLVLPNDMLTKVDFTGMMYSLEIRPPFLDHHVVEFVNSLPVSYKINGNERKILLRKTFGSQLPASVFQRSKKGFEVPIENWLRNELKGLVFEKLNAQKIVAQNIFSVQWVNQLMDDFYKKNSSKHTSLLYSMLVFAMWYEYTFAPSN